MLKKFENLYDIKQILDINLKGTKLMKNMIDLNEGMREWGNYKLQLECQLEWGNYKLQLPK